MKISLWSVVSFLGFAFLILFVFDGWQNNSTFEFLQSSEERLECGEEIGNIPSDESGDSHRYKVIQIETNRVDYPLKKERVMLEYCVTVANFNQEVGGLWVTVQFLDEGGNVLTEGEERVADIPGMRTKTVYGAQFLSPSLADEIVNYNVTSR